MIAALSIFLFLAFFFLALAVVHFIRFEENEARRRIERRFAESRGEKSPRLAIEKKERLSDIGAFDRLLKTVRKARDFQAWLRQSGIAFSPGAFLLTTAFLGACSLLAAGFGGADARVAGGIAAAVMAAPFFYVSLLRQRRRKKFQEGFPDAVSRLASSLRAGYSLPMALEEVVQEGGNCVAREFRSALQEMSVGQSLEGALKSMLRRMDVPELRLFIASVILQKESGGNLAVLLDNLETTLRERFELQRELQTATAQARLSGMVLALLPVFVGFFVFLIHRNYLLFLFDDPVGRRLLTFSLAGEIGGALWIRRIVKIEI